MDLINLILNSSTKLLVLLHFILAQLICYDVFFRNFYLLILHLHNYFL